MRESAGKPTAGTDRRLRACRWAVPAAALLLLGVMTLLWTGGERALYFTILKLFGFAPFRFPFLDIHAVLAAAKCQRLGIDIYLANPCDALGRVHVYSPLWLVLTPGFLGTGQTNAVGLALDLAFVAALCAVLRPATAGEAALAALVALSPCTVYALERANNDLLVFALVAAGCALDRARHPWRLASYALFLFAGLLKYYPLALLALLAREPKRTAIQGAACAAAIVLGLAAIGHADLAKALADIPALSYYADSFSARNLPFGVAEALAQGGARHAVGLGLFGLLAVLAVARARRTAPLFDRGEIDWSGFAVQTMLAGALLMAGCFAAGQNVLYRGVWLILVMPGLAQGRRAATDPRARRFLTQVIAAVLVVAWEEPLRLAVDAVAGASAAPWLRPRIEMMFWLGRELVWWWLVSGLAALLLAWFRRLPLVAEALAEFLRAASIVARPAGRPPVPAESAEPRRDRRQGRDVDAVARRLGDQGHRVGPVAQAGERP